MSYLKGPLKRDEIARLTAAQKSQPPEEEPAIPSGSGPGGFGPAPVLPASIPQRFEPDPTGSHRYRPWLAARAKVEFHDQRRGIDQSRERQLWLALDPEMEAPVWEASEAEDLPFGRWPARSPSKALFAPLPPFVNRDSGLKRSTSALREWLYREERLELYRCRKLRLESTPEESEADFLVRVRERLDELKEEAIEKLRERYASKESRLEDQLRRAQERIDKEKADQTSSLISVGASLIGALFGGRGLSASKIGTAINRSGRVLKERGDLSRAEAKVEEIREKIDALSDELEEKLDAIDEKYSLENYPVESFSIRPKKSAVTVEKIALVWRPAL
jgi:gas vesicle protein